MRTTGLDRDSMDHAASAVLAAEAGDEAAFGGLAERYRRELGLHCYRMLGSYEDSQDLVQETFLRAWRGRATIRTPGSFRAWLYRIATNACLDFLARNQRAPREVRVLGPDDAASAQPQFAPHVAWLQPWPDTLLEPMAPREHEPDALVVARESVELAFVVAMMHLPPRQRAVLILRDVLDWPARETAELLDMTTPAVNSALIRARESLERLRGTHRTAAPAHGRAAPGDRERELIRRYVEATDRNDPSAIAELLRDDVRFSMPPEEVVIAGRDKCVEAWVEGGFGSAALGEFRGIVTAANGMPAVANYFRRPGEAGFRPFTLDVLAIEDGLIAEITAFDLEPVREALGLPLSL